MISFAVDIVITRLSYWFCPLIIMIELVHPGKVSTPLPFGILRFLRSWPVLKDQHTFAISYNFHLMNQGPITSVALNRLSVGCHKDKQIEFNLASSNVGASIFVNCYLSEDVSVLNGKFSSALEWQFCSCGLVGPFFPTAYPALRTSLVSAQ